jgi:hypothetical protein
MRSQHATAESAELDIAQYRVITSSSRIYRRSGVDQSFRSAQNDGSARGHRATGSASCSRDAEEHLRR